MNVSNGLSRQQQGAVLATALIFMLVATLVAVAAMNVSTVGLKLSRNEQVRFEAQEKAQAVIGELSAAIKDIPVDVQAGQVQCLSRLSQSRHDDPDCLESSSALSLDSLESDEPVFAEIQRVEPLMLAPRRELAMSSAKFSMAVFAVRARYDGAEYGQGFADVEQAVGRLVRNDERTN